VGKRPRRSGHPEFDFRYNERAALGVNDAADLPFESSAQQAAEEPANHILEAVELVKTGKAADLAFEEQA
jgi:hypothetical protein